MHTLFLVAGVAAMALVGPASGQDKGKGGPGGGGPAGKGGGGPGGPPGKGGGQDRGGPPRDGGGKGPKADRGGPGRGPEMRTERGKQDRGPEMRAERGRPDRGPEIRGDRGGPGRGPDMRADRGPGRSGPPAPPRGPDFAGKGGDARRDWKDGPGGKGGRPDWKGKGPDAKGGGPGGRAFAGPVPDFDPRAPTARFASRRWEGNAYRWAPRDDYAIPVSYGCPSGLIQRGDGCYAPATLQPLQPGGGWANWYPAQYQNDDYEWAYGDGYLYRYDQDRGGLGGLGGLGSGLGGGLGGLISAFIPLLGGQLFGGNTWPPQYDDYQVPQYYDRFYGSGYDGNYDYRYADDAIFAVDPQSNRIDSIAGLLTGDAWGVGQRMPVGYDLYNVPQQYRSRFADDADHMYRYSDGYVYDVDPTTQLVRAVSELLG